MTSREKEGHSRKRSSRQDPRSQRGRSRDRFAKDRSVERRKPADKAKGGSSRDFQRSSKRSGEQRRSGRGDGGRGGGGRGSGGRGDSNSNSNSMSSSRRFQSSTSSSFSSSRRFSKQDDHRRRRRTRSTRRDRSSERKKRKKRRRERTRSFERRSGGRSFSSRGRRKGSSPAPAAPPPPPPPAGRHQRHDENRRRADYEESPYNRRRRHSVDSSSRETPRHEDADRKKRRRRKKRGRERRRDRAGSRSASHSPRPPPVAADVPPRAGVVSDDDDAAAVSGTATNNTATTATTAATAAESHKTSPDAKRRGSASSSHDDTTGHFKGREGSTVADRYRILREVGVGTFGRVVKCLDLKKRARFWRRDRHDSVVAIKIVRNIKRYYESALIEADIIEDVNRRGGRGVSHCAIMYDAFSFSGHYCMVFESLGPSLYDFLKRQKYQPFPLVCIRDFAKQLLETLEFLHSFRLIHTDLKPENILLLNDREVSYKGYNIPECTRIKVIDFGGATYDNEKKSSIVNTRQYRAPEVILGVGWSMPSDLWSIGCILAELYQGELLFATHDNVEHLALIEKVIGTFPRRMLKRAQNADLTIEAFDSAGDHRMGSVLPPESLAYVKRIGPLESVIFKEDVWLLRLLRRILVIDPDERATARECLRKF